MTFDEGQRKDDVAAAYLGDFESDEGIAFVGKAQEKISTFRTCARRNPVTGQRYPWIYRTTAMVNAYYFYGVDRDFGPFFIKFSSYFPYTGKVYINGHEWLKRQAQRRGLAFDALDNGIASCSDPRPSSGTARRRGAAGPSVYPCCGVTAGLGGTGESYALEGPRAAKR